MWPFATRGIWPACPYGLILWLFYQRRSIRISRKTFRCLQFRILS